VAKLVGGSDWYAVNMSSLTPPILGGNSGDRLTSASTTAIRGQIYDGSFEQLFTGTFPAGVTLSTLSGTVNGWLVRIGQNDVLNFTDLSTDLPTLVATLTSDPLNGWSSLFGGDDSVTGSKTADRLLGFTGNDTLNGDDGTDSMFGNAGLDQLYGGAGADVVYGNAGNDSLFGGAAADTLFGGQDADHIEGNEDGDFVYGNLGNDTVAGGKGADQIQGGQGDDLLYGNVDDDYLNGNVGNDVVFGGQGNDAMNGAAGNDILYGNAGDDGLFGDDGDDTLVAGIGNDRMIGGAGADSFVFGMGDGYDIIEWFNWQEGDRIVLQGTTTLPNVGVDEDGNARVEISTTQSIRLVGLTQAEVRANLASFITFT
jgi:Ca2+-binding RTX toxin-like protein